MLDNMDLVKLAAGMRPAGYFINRAIAVEMMESCIRVRLKSTLEVLQMLSRMVAETSATLVAPISWQKLSNAAQTSHVSDRRV